MYPNSKAALLPLWAIAGLQLVFASAHTAAQSQALARAPVSPAPANARPDPADPKVPVPASLYVSSLRAFQGFAEPQVAPWRETNASVRQRGHAGEVREPDPTKPAAPGAAQPLPVAKPASGGHAGHAGHAGHEMK